MLRARGHNHSAHAEVRRPLSRAVVLLALWVLGAELRPWMLCPKRAYLQSHLDSTGVFVLPWAWERAALEGLILG